MPSSSELLETHAITSDVSKIDIVLNGNANSSENTRNIILIAILAVLAVILFGSIIVLARSNNARYARTDYESDDEEEEKDNDENQKNKTSEENEGEEHEEEMSEISTSDANPHVK